MTGHSIHRGLAVLAAASLGASLAITTLTAPVGAAGRVTCNGKVATIVGTKKDDVIRGTERRDIIAGLGGDDIILGLGGDDLICGGPGNDRLVGNAGRDVLIGAAGRDRLVGGVANDRLLGGLGPDVLDGGPNFDVCRQGPGIGPLIRCEVPAPVAPAPSPLPTPTLIPLTGILAIAYSDIDGLDGYSTGDVLISKLVDSSGDGKPSWGDTVRMGRYPTNLDATAFADWGIQEHLVDLAEVYSHGGVTQHIGTLAPNGDRFDWYVIEGAYTYEWYQEETHGSGYSAFFDVHVDPDPSVADSLRTMTTSPSQPLGGNPLGGNTSLNVLRQVDNGFLDVEIVYQAP